MRSYKSWKIIFEKHFKYFKEDCIFVWHSLGWTFLTKYFNENPCFDNKKPLTPFLGGISGWIWKVILVAPWFKDNKIWEVLWSFNFDKNLENLKNIQDKIVIFWSKAYRLFLSW